MIALVGNPFSSRYARARRAGPAPACEHVAMNVSLHGPSTRAWCLTERTSRALRRGPQRLSIGESSLSVGDGALTVRLDERTAPFGGRVRGEVHVELGARSGAALALDHAGRHRWWPIAPEARAEVRLETPSARFTGSAYLDAQAGDEPLEAAFRGWSWSRMRRPGDTVVTFDLAPRTGDRIALSRRFRGGTCEPGPEAPERSLPATGWRLARTVRSEGTPRLERTLEDGPCYARALVQATLGGDGGVAVHEILDLDRLQTAWVRFLMPFRSRRGA